MANLTRWKRQLKSSLLVNSALCETLAPAAIEDSYRRAQTRVARIVLVAIADSDHVPVPGAQLVNPEPDHFGDWAAGCVAGNVTGVAPGGASPGATSMAWMMASPPRVLVNLIEMTPFFGSMPL